MRQSYIFDTSFIVSLLRKNDSNHDKALQIAAHLDEQRAELFINEMIYAEVLTVLRVRWLGDTIEIFDKLLTTSQIQMITGNVIDYCDYFKSFESKCSVQDCSVLYDANKYNLTPVTFDQEMMSFYLR
jgi:predicted nucleic acid-binding protein